MAKVTELRGRLGPLPGEGRAAEGRCNPWFGALLVRNGVQGHAARGRHSCGLLKKHCCSKCMPRV